MRTIADSISHKPSKGKKFRRRLERSRREQERCDRMQSEVCEMDMAMSAILSDSPMDREYEPWTGPPHPRPIGPVNLSTSYAAHRKKCRGEAYIYGIADPRDHVIRYVGKTAQELDERLHDHEFSPSNARLCGMLMGLRRAGLKAEIVVLDICLRYRWWKREEFWIAAVSTGGTNLFNVSVGGRFDNPRNRKGKEWKRARGRVKRAKESGMVRFVPVHGMPRE